MKPMTSKPPLMIRQGDVLLEYVDDVPAGVQEPLDPKRGLVIAEGEATGHSHRVPRRHAMGRAVALRDETDARYMHITAPVPLRHEEHKTRCWTCHLAGKYMIATARLADGYDREAYRCQEHALDADVVALSEPGASDLPRGTARVTIHAEYQPGALARNVAD